MRKNSRPALKWRSKRTPVHARALLLLAAVLPGCIPVDEDSANLDHQTISFRFFAFTGEENEQLDDAQALKKLASARADKLCSFFGHSASVHFTLRYLAYPDSPECLTEDECRIRYSEADWKTSDWERYLNRTETGLSPEAYSIDFNSSKIALRAAEENSDDAPVTKIFASAYFNKVTCVSNEGKIETFSTLGVQENAYRALGSSVLQDAVLIDLKNLVTPTLMEKPIPYVLRNNTRYVYIPNFPSHAKLYAGALNDNIRGSANGICESMGYKKRTVFYTIDWGTGQNAPLATYTRIITKDEWYDKFSDETMNLVRASFYPKPTFEWVEDRSQVARVPIEEIMENGDPGYRSYVQAHDAATDEPGKKAAGVALVQRTGYFTALVCKGLSLKASSSDD